MSFTPHSTSSRPRDSHAPAYCLILAACAFFGVAESEDLASSGLDPGKRITQYSHRIWTTDQGLPQNSVQSIVQTSDGYLWIATQEGVARFDGIDFKVYNMKSTGMLRNNFISDLCADRSGGLWIATYASGILWMHNDSLSLLPSTGVKPDEGIQALLEDRTGRLWIGTRDRGVLAYKEGRCKMLTVSDGLPSNSVTSLYEDADGSVWIGTNEGLSRFTNETLESIPITALPGRSVRTVCRDRRGTLWIGTDRGLGRQLGHGWRLTATPDGSADTRVNCLLCDRRGTLWAGTDGGLLRHANEVFEVFTKRDGLSDNVVTDLFEDREGNLWVGTDGGGLNLFRDATFTSFSAREGLISNDVWTIMEDRRSRVWVGTDDGLTRIEWSQGRLVTKSYGIKDGLSDRSVLSLLDDRDGTMWIGTERGLDRCLGDRLVHVTDAHLRQTAVLALMQDAEGTVWIGTRGNGVLKVRHGSYESFTTKDGLAGDFISCFCEEPGGSVWVGTDGYGLSRIDGRKIVNLSRKDGLSSDIVLSLYADSGGVIWVGTLGGSLCRYAHGSFTAFTSKEGMFDDVVYQILDDGRGRLWMSSNRGIFYARKADLSNFAEGKISSMLTVAFGKEDGLPSEECNGGVQPAGWKTHDGRLWFPTTQGVTTVDPGDLRENDQAPLVVINEMVVDNQSVGISQAVELSPGKSRFEFHFTGLSFAAPNKIRFRYRLEGYDADWIDVGTRRAAYYTRIPPGEYTFRVRAGNSDGVWNMSGASLPFLLRAHFYESSIFYISLVVLIFLATVGMHQVRIKRVEARQRELERTVEERTGALRAEKRRTEDALREVEDQRKLAVEANRLKTALLSMAAHEFKNPLVSIRSMAQIILDRSRGQKESHELSSIIEQDAQKVITLLNDLLSFSAIESGRIQVNNKPTSIDELALVAVNLSRPHAARKRQTIEMRTEGSGPYVSLTDPALVTEAMDNLLSNAIKYSPAGAEIGVTVRADNAAVRFEVHDQGPGLTEEDRSNLFTKFHTLSAKPTGGETATGLGLSIVKEIMTQLKGRVLAEPDCRKGSLFVLELPRLS